MNDGKTEAQPSAWEEARRQGVDMELLEASFHMTPDERILEHRCACRDAGTS
jgi:hypothetical protein